MDLSLFPPDLRAIMEMQLALGGGGGTPGPLPVAAPLPAPLPAQFGAPIGLPAGSNPLLAGNDDLRRQFAAQPELAARNAEQWLNEREAHILGNDASPAAPATPALPAAPAGMDPGFYQAMLDAGAHPHDPEARFQLASPLQAGEPNPLLAGNDELRRQFAEHPELAPRNAEQWLNEREAHILGNDLPPAESAPPAAPAPPTAPAGMDLEFYQAMLAAGAHPHDPEASTSPVQPAPSLLSQPFAGNLSAAPPPLSPPPLPDQPSLPDPFLAPPATPEPAAPAPKPMDLAQLPQLRPVSSLSPAPAPKPEGLAQLPQLPPVVSSLSPTPASPARANIDNQVTLPTPTFTPAPKLPELPKYSGALTPNLGAYSPAPQMPGYGLARTGSPYRAPQAQLPGLPTFAQLADPGLALGPDLSPGPQTYLPQPVAQEPLYAKYSGRSLFA